MVVLRDIPFNSMCEHHLMPFEGKAHIAYIPGGKVLGLSKLARLVDVFAHRPQVQERLTSQVADVLADRLNVKGCAVVLEAVHTCMTCRGVKKPGQRHGHVGPARDHAHQSGHAGGSAGAPAQALAQPIPATHVKLLSRT